MNKECLHCNIKRFLKILLVILACSAFAAVKPYDKEYLIKAGFIQKFANYTHWPGGGCSETKNAPFVIAVLGISPFNGILEEMYAGQKVGKCPVEIRYIQSPSEADGVQVIFIASSETNRVDDIVSQVCNDPVLMISEVRGAGEKGVHVNYYLTAEGTIHFEINPKAIKQSNLSMNPLLIDLGKVISTKE